MIPPAPLEGSRHREVALYLCKSSHEFHVLPCGFRHRKTSENACKQTGPALVIRGTNADLLLAPMELCRPTKSLLFLTVLLALCPDLHMASAWDMCTSVINKVSGVREPICQKLPGAVFCQLYPAQISPLF